MRRPPLVVPIAVAVLAVGVAAFPAVGGQGSGESEVRAVVAQLLQTQAQLAIVTLRVDQGDRSDREGVRLDVLSNVAAGYAVTVTRTALSRGDLPIRLDGVPPADPALVLDLPTMLTLAPPGVPLLFGHRTGSISSAVGDRWRLRVLAGPIGCPATGIHTGELVFTTQAGPSAAMAPVTLRVDVRRNRKACG